MGSLASCNAWKIGSKAGSSRPRPSPVVPMITPRTWESVGILRSSCRIASRGAERGSVANAYILSGYRAQRCSTSSLIRTAVSAASEA